MNHHGWMNKIALRNLQKKKINNFKFVKTQAIHAKIYRDERQGLLASGMCPAQLSTKLPTEPV